MIDRSLDKFNIYEMWRKGREILKDAEEVETKEEVGIRVIVEDCTWRGFKQLWKTHRRCTQKGVM